MITIIIDNEIDMRWNDIEIEIAMIMRLMNGTKAIKNGPKSKNKRRVNAYCLASIKMVGLVCP